MKMIFHELNKKVLKQNSIFKFNILEYLFIFQLFIHFFIFLGYFIIFFKHSQAN